MRTRPLLRRPFPAGQPLLATYSFSILRPAFDLAIIRSARCAAMSGFHEAALSSALRFLQIPNADFAAYMMLYALIAIYCQPALHHLILLAFSPDSQRPFYFRSSGTHYMAFANRTAQFDAPFCCFDDY